MKLDGERNLTSLATKQAYMRTAHSLVWTKSRVFTYTQQKLRIRKRLSVSTLYSLMSVLSFRLAEKLSTRPRACDLLARTVKLLALRRHVRTHLVVD